jgi:hypothetical protein
MSLPIRSIPPPAAPKRTLGRPKDTTDIAVFINDLRIKGKSWKATWVACKEQFHGRITAREKQGKEQVRSMWERHFAGKK